MAVKYTDVVPKRPFLRRQTFEIPDSYRSAYYKEGVKDDDEHIMLYHGTQFGGFRLRKIPQQMRYDGEFIEKWFRTEKVNGYYVYGSNSRFLQTFGHLEIEPLLRNWRQDAVNREEMKAEGFEDQDIFDAEVFLEGLNFYYSDVRVSIAMPTSGLTPKDRIDLSRFHGIPYLVKKPKTGGRFFHPESSYQRLRSELRPMIKINGEETSEVDLSAAVLQFLNISLEQRGLSTLESMFEHDDPYDYFLGTMNSEEFLRRYLETPTEREGLKSILYTAIYSTDVTQERHVNYRLRGREFRFHDLLDYFADFFGALGDLRERGSQYLHKVINREESRFAQEVLTRGCIDEHIPILPIHDSFIVPRAAAQDLTGILDETAQKMYGKHLRYKQKY